MISEDLMINESFVPFVPFVPFVSVVLRPRECW